jgi:hypothetical protein
MTEDYPGPPPELVQVWRAAASNVPASLSTDSGGRRDYIDYIATQAARWGADQELEACISWLDTYVPRYCEWSANFRAARRPKPPSLKEQAFEQLRCIQIDLNKFGMGISTDTIRRALEQLDD